MFPVLCSIRAVLICLLLAVNINCVDSEYSDTTHKVHCETTKGPFDLDIYASWSPLGAERFMNLVRDNFFTDIALYRCVEGFLTQFGVSDDPSKKKWHNWNIEDDPNLHKGIHRGYLSFAGGGPNTRSSQLFIAFERLDFLGKEPWETPFGRVVNGLETLDAFYKGYGDMPPFGHGPDQQKLFNRGNEYIRDEFPLIDFIQSCHEVMLERFKEEITSGEANQKIPDRLQRRHDHTVDAIEKIKAPEKISDTDDKQLKIDKAEHVSAEAHKSVVSVMKPPYPDVRIISQQTYLRSPVELGNKMYLVVAAVSILCIGLLFIFCTLKKMMPYGKSV